MKRIPAPRVAAVLGTVAAALLLGGCGDTQSGPDATTPVAAATSMPGMDMSAAPAADTTPVATNTVKIENFAFSPAVVTVKAGTTVTWTNNDTDPHTVTSMNNGPVKSPPMQQGDTFHYTFTTPGKFEYLCTIHPFMTATVVVTP
ncbi:MAG TPA: cupredoxin domain-containing protein [Pseudonocardia sp.]|jgi:plastocyanin